MRLKRENQSLDGDSDAFAPFQFGMIKIKIDPAEVDTVAAYLVDQHRLVFTVADDLRFIEEGMGMSANDQVDIFSSRCQKDVTGDIWVTVFIPQVGEADDQMAPFFFP